MKKKLLTCMIAIFSVCALAAGALAVSAEEGEDGAAGGTQLFLPTSYEQYLDLKNPSDFAVSDDYIAIADGNKIYLYDKGAGKYEVFTHTDGSTLASLNFFDTAAASYLYFVDNNTNVYYLNCSEFGLASEAVSTGFTCASFIIDGSNFYYGRTTDGATVYKTTVSEDSLTEGAQIGKADTNITPYFSLCNGVVYFSLNSKIYSIKSGTATQNPWDLTTSVTAFSVAGDKVFYSTTGTDKDFYIYENQSSVPVRYKDEAIKGVPAVKTIGETLWFIDQDTGRGAIRTIQPNTTDAGGYSFTEYEIGKYSQSEARLGQNAGDIAVYKNNLLIADTENNRVLSSGKLADGSYTPTVSVSTGDISPDIICAGEYYFAVADGRELRIFSYGGEEKYKETFTGDVTSIAYSYENFYVSVNGQSLLYKYSSEFEKEEHILTFVPEFLTADVYGNLYALQSSSVRRLTQDYSPDTAFSMSAPVSTEKILSDFAGNIYALSGDVMYFLEENVAPKSVFSQENIGDLLYHESANLPIVSFAFGFESGEVFLLSDGFIAKTDVLSIRSLTELDAEGVYGMIFSQPQESTKPLLLEVKENAITVRLDLNEMQEGAAWLPYHGYEKNTAVKTGVVLGETADGKIVAFYDSSDRSYEIHLVLSGSAGTESEYYTAVPESEYLTATNGNQYTVNAVGLYKYPLMLVSADANNSNRFEAVRLGRSVTVSLLSKISHEALDTDYYFVSVTTGGVRYYGYIPASYLSVFSGSAAYSYTDFRYAHIDKGESCILKNTVTGEEKTFENKEKLKVYYKNADENGNVYVVYTGEEGTFTGYVDPDILYEATPVVLVTLVIVTIAAAAIILSVCYLILRQQPTLQ